MTATTVLVCSGRGCAKPLTRHAYRDRHGRRYCQRCSNRLPSHLRRKRTDPKGNR